MGCSESKELTETAVVGSGKPPAASTNGAATATKPAAATAAAAATPTTPTATAKPPATANSFKAFRDPSVALRKIVDTVSVKMRAGGASSVSAGVVGAVVGGGVQAMKLAAAARAHHVRNVFATPYTDTEIDSYQPPVHPKNSVTAKFITAALGRNFVFEQLSAKELLPLVSAFESVTVPIGQVIIRQGDVGDYFYIIGTHQVVGIGDGDGGEGDGGEGDGEGDTDTDKYSGRGTGQCVFEVDGKEVGRAGVGNSFGELALLYTCPRAATVTATEETTLYRVDQKTFRFILQNQTKQGSKTKGELLSGVDFLKDLDASELFKLASVMTPKRFNKGDYLIRKGDMADYFYLVSEGTLTATDIAVGDTTYEDVVLQPGNYVGERALVTGEPRAANVVAKTDGMAFCIDKETFETVLGKLSVLILRSQDRIKLSGIKCIKDTHLDPQTLSSLANLIVDRKFKSGIKIFTEGQGREAALYFVREGKVSITNDEGTRKEIIEAGGYFGNEQLLADAAGELVHARGSLQTIAKYTATVTDDCNCGVLTLAECGKIIDTNNIGKGKSSRYSSIVKTKFTLESLKRHTILGAGTFGQVWLVSSEAADGKQVAYALKIQSKYELCQDGQAKAVVDEKNIMSQLHHPFISNLVDTYSDPGYVYMLMEMVQGGELYSIIHTNRRDGVREDSAKFYAAGIAEGLAYMHRRGFVYRDLKPENVMLDAEGYPVIVDFGFAKYVTDKTYTLCGTPLYLAPEVILNRGHTFSADHWSLGVLTYEMITGFTPFYFDGMEQMDLFRAIVKGLYEKPRTIQPLAASIIDGFLTKSPTKRLGSLAGGEEDIYKHPWFEDIDFAALRNKQIKAPLVPKIKDPLDASNFEDWSHLDDKTKQRYPKLTPAQAQLFDKF